MRGRRERTAWTRWVARTRRFSRAALAVINGRGMLFVRGNRHEIRMLGCGLMHCTHTADTRPITVLVARRRRWLIPELGRQVRHRSPPAGDAADGIGPDMIRAPIGALGATIFVT